MGNKSIGNASRHQQQRNSSRQESRSANVVPADNRAVSRGGGILDFAAQQNRMAPQIPQFPPLIVYRDSDCQTTETAMKKTTKKYNFGLLLLGICVVFLSMYALVYSAFMNSKRLQSMLVYVNFVKFPFGDLTDLQRFGLIEARNINITTDDRVMLKGWHLVHKKDILRVSQLRLLNSTNALEAYFDESLSHSSRIILFFHGNAGTRGVGFRVRMAQQMASLLDAHVVVIDYRGFGDSEGQPSEEGTNFDAHAVVKWVDSILVRERPNARLFRSKPKSRCKDKQSEGNNGAPNHLDNNRPHLFIYGHSLGTAISVQLALELNRANAGSVSGVILDAPFTTMADASMDHPLGAPFRIFPFMKSLMRKYLQFKYPSIDRILDIGTNLLILHGSRDNKIPISHSRELLLAASQAVDLNVTATESYSGRIIRFVEALQAGHDGVHSSAEWVTSVPAFIRGSEANIAAVAEKLEDASQQTCDLPDDFQEGEEEDGSFSLDDLLDDIENSEEMVHLSFAESDADISEQGDAEEEAQEVEFEDDLE